MKKLVKKITAVALSAVMLTAFTVPAMAEPANCFVKFVSNGQVTGVTVPAGSNVTAPEAPAVGGFTFVGYDKSLKNITENTTITGVYVQNILGDAAIQAAKASIATPAISATRVADPNAVPVAPVVLPAAVSTVANQAATAATQAAATVTADDAAAVQAALAALLAQAAAQNTAATATTTTAATADQTATTPAATTPAATTPAATTPAATPAVTTPAVVPGIPSWVVGLEGVDAAGAANAYNYLKNTKGLDDASIQANWGAFMHHYAGHGVSGW